MINVGSMIGSGIFIVPAAIALGVGSSALIIGVWIVGGIVSLFGSLSIAELGVLMPRAGGQYVYIREAYSPLWGFLYGWAAFTVINTASIAAVAMTFAIYLGYFFPLDPTGLKLIAVASIVLLTIVNCFGIKLGARIQNGFTLAKIAALALLCSLSLIWSGGSVGNFSPLLPALPLSGIAGPITLAIVAVLWAYDGWIEITYVAGEVIDPGRNLPRALFRGTLLVMAVYILANFSMIYVLSPAGMAQSSLVASDAATKILGSGGAAFISLAVIISTFGTNNGYIFTCPRIYYEMAREGLFFKKLAEIHPRYETPVASLIAQAVISMILVITGSYVQLATYVVFASWIFYAMSAGAVIILRKRRGDAARPYKTWGYPLTPILFILFSMCLVASTIMEDPKDSLIGAGIIVTGVPAYFYWKQKSRPVVER